MKRYLICNADDFGIGERVTDAIIDCHVYGIISSTTLMCNMPAAEYAARRAQEVPSLGVGVHLTLTQGQPLNPADSVPDLVDDQGKFLSSKIISSRMWYGKHIAEQVRKEFTLQIERALALGICPTHLDTHHGVQKRPVTRSVIIELCQRFNIKGVRTHRGLYWTSPDAKWTTKWNRIKRNCIQSPRLFMRWWNHHQLRGRGLWTPDRMVSTAYLIPKSGNEREQLLACIRNIPGGVSELVFHPGYPDPAVSDSEHFAQVRRGDAQLAGCPDIREALDAAGVNLISFRQPDSL